MTTTRQEEVKEDGLPQEEGREEDVPEEGRLRRRRADGQEEAFQTKHGKTLDILTDKEDNNGPKEQEEEEDDGPEEDGRGEERRRANR